MRKRSGSPSSLRPDAVGLYRRLFIVTYTLIVVILLCLPIFFIPQPEAPPKMELAASIISTTLVIEHKGGPVLHENNVRIYLGVNTTFTRYAKISDGMAGAKTWSKGENWSMDISNEIVMAQDTNSEVFVQIMDTRHKEILFEKTFDIPQDPSRIPDLGIERGSLIFSDMQPSNSVLITISVKVVNFGPVNVSDAVVKFFDGTTLIKKVERIGQLNRSGLLDDRRIVSIVWRTTYLGKHIISATVVPRPNERNTANNYISDDLCVNCDGAKPDLIKPNLILKSLQIGSDPVHSKEPVTVTATVGNSAKITATGFQLELGDVFENKNTTLNKTTYKGNVTYIKDVEIQFNWTPMECGPHRFWANITKVLPSGEDPMANANSIIDRDYLETVYEVIPTILVVDDDHEPDGSTDATTNVTDALGFLNYDYDIYKVQGAADANGPTIGVLENYPYVIWAFGNQSQGTLTHTDISALGTYLVDGTDRNLLLIGKNLANDDAFWNNVLFRQATLGLKERALDKGIPSVLYGVKDKFIAHGAKYDIRNGTNDRADQLTPVDGGEPVLTDGLGNPYGIAYHNTQRSNYKAVVLGFDYSSIDGKDNRSDFLYSIMRWFGKTDLRIDLKVARDDISLKNDEGLVLPLAESHPVVGRRYQLIAQVWNIGGSPVKAEVQFYEGTNYLGSVNPNVPAMTLEPDRMALPGKVSITFPWVPADAGKGWIVVRIDPDGRIPFSNDPLNGTGRIFKTGTIADQAIEIHYLYDDFEHGPGNWTHEISIIRINGEQPIEYLNDTSPVGTNVVGNIDWNATNGWNISPRWSHSSPASFKVNEPRDWNNPVFPSLKLAICIDDSGSMSWNDPKYQRLDAVKKLIKWSFLYPGDLVAIYRFGTEVTNLFETLNQTGSYDQYPFNSTISYLENRPKNYTFNNNHGLTSLHSCISKALQEMDPLGIPYQYPIIIAITDGTNNNGVTFQNELPLVRSSGVPLYMVGMGNEASTNEMYDLAEASNGGKYYHSLNADTIGQVLSKLIYDSGLYRPDDPAPKRDENSQVGPILPQQGYSDETGSRALGKSGGELVMLNPVGGESWNGSITRNITWACKASVRATCNSASIYISYNNGDWIVMGREKGTRLVYPGHYESIWYSKTTDMWYPNRPYPWIEDPQGFEVFTYAWHLPNDNALDVRLKICIDSDLTTCAESGRFDIHFTYWYYNFRASVYNLTTGEVNTRGLSKATLRFWQLYDLLYTENGGVVQVGTSSTENGVYKYKYVYPTQPYTGNLRLDKNVHDNYGNLIRWAWNGRSGGGTFTWEPVEVDLTPVLDPARPWMKIRFSFYTWGYGNGGSWWIDDITVTAQSDHNKIAWWNSPDNWEYYSWQAGIDPSAMRPHSGTHMWWNHDPLAGNDLTGGTDDSLRSPSIDLRNARDPRLSAYFKFNIDGADGRPPDGFRVEGSSDNGMTWAPLNEGPRASSGISGHWSKEGKSPDGKKAVGGIQDGGGDSTAPVWVEAGTLWKLETNLTNWTGKVIILRFRVVTDLDLSHYGSDVTFKGLAIDDIIVREGP